MGQERGKAWPVWAAAGASLAWLGWAVTALGGLDVRALAPREGIALVAELLVLPALLFALAAALRAGAAAQARVSGEELLEAAEAAEARTTGLATRLSALRAQLASDAEAAETASRAIEERAGGIAALIAQALRDARELEAAATAVGAATQAATAGADGARAALTAAAEAARESEAAMLAGVEQLRAATAALGQSAGASAADVREAADRLEAEGRERMAALAEAIDAAGREAAAVLETTGAATRAIGEEIGSQTAAIARAIAEARGALTQIGAEAARAIGRHLEGLVAQARELEGRLAAQAAATETLATGAERGFQLLDKRLEHSAQTTSATLARLDEQLAATRARIDSLAEPVRVARAAVSDLAAATSALDEAAKATLDRVSGSLAPETGRVRAEAEGLATGFDRVAAALGAVTRQASELADQVATSEAAIGAVAQRLAEQREAITTAGEALVVELEQARQLIAEVERTTEATSLAAATRLVDALARVREVSAQATGTMRAMLDKLVAEAGQSLGETARTALRASFVEPIAREARAAEERARAAAERSAASLAALASTLRLVEERASTTQAALARAEEADLVATAEFLLQRLAAESVSIASALGRPMEAEDWARWRRGERSLFNRRLVQLLEEAERAELGALFARDPAAAGAARRYVGGFDSLLSRLEARGEKTLAGLLRNSDSGRLAAALTEALGG
ncbi:hypothetical protein [Thermaurantiacus sp.]